MSSIIKGQRIRSESILSLTPMFSEKTTSDNTKNEPRIQDAEQAYANQAYVDQVIQEAEERAKAIIKHAEKEAENIIAESQQKANDERIKILNKSEQDGYEKGYNEGALEAQSLVEQGKEIIQNAYLEKQTLLKQSEPEMIKLVINICQKLLNEEISFNPNIITVLIRKSLEEVGHEISNIAIKVPKGPYDYIVENKKQILEDHINPEDVEIVKDTTLADGVCIVETSFGNVECNIMQQFEELKKQIRLLASDDLRREHD